MSVRPLPLVGLFSLLAWLPSCAGSPLSMSLDGDVVHILSNGEPFATVHASAEPRPYVWPLFGPGGVEVTRNHPMAGRDGEQSDHPHHQSLWLAHGSVNGFDFWHGKGHRERVVLHAMHTAVGHDLGAFVHCEYKWLVDDDTLVMNELRQMRFQDHGDARMIDVVVEFRAVADDVRFGDTKEGMFAMRVHPALRVSGKIANGALRNSEGRNGKAVWGQRARWIDDSGIVDGKQVGVTMMDHPKNLRFPTWWHARTYGLLAANPFGVHDFEKQPAGTGDFVLKKGETLSLRYRVLLHSADWDDARIESAYEDWVRS
jgi:hypothetical protein